MDKLFTKRNLPFHDVNLWESHRTHVVVVVFTRVVDIFEVKGEEPTPESFLAIGFEDLVFDVETTCLLEMIKYKSGEETSASGSNDADLQRSTSIVTIV